MKLIITKSGNLKSASLPKSCSFSYAKKLQKKYFIIGIKTVVTRHSHLSSVIIDNYFIN